MERRLPPGDDRTTERLGDTTLPEVPGPGSGAPGAGRADTAFAETLPRGDAPIVVNRRTIGRFRIDADLGSGGMADVYRAHDPMLERAVALKVLHARRSSSADADTSGLRRVLREARAAAALTHPNTVTIYEVGEADGEVFIAMELLRGSSLRDVLVGGNASVEDKLRWLVQAAGALAAAHARGLVHRDVKPENMFVCTDGSLKLLDFGIAKRDEREFEGEEAYSTGPSSLRTESGLRFGTPRYMAPEQRAGAGTDVRTDQFAWGLVAFELFAGDAPTSEALATAQGESDALPVFETRAERVAALAVHAPELPTPLAQAIARALEPVKEDRFASMNDILAVFEEHARDSRVAPALPTPARTAPAPPPSRRRAVVLGLAVVLGSVAVLGGVKLRERLVARSAAAAASAAREEARVRAGIPACHVVDRRVVPLTASEQAVPLPDGTVVFARDPAVDGLHLQQVDGARTRELLPFPLGGPSGPDRIRSLVARGLDYQGTSALFAGIIVGEVTRAEPTGGSLMLLGERARLSLQRARGVPNGIDAQSGGNAVFVAVTTSAPDTHYQGTLGVAVYALGTPIPNAISDVEHGAAGNPTIAVGTTRLGVAYQLHDEVHVAFLDRGLQRMGDVVRLPVEAPPLAVFARDRLLVYWVANLDGKTRIARAALAPDETRFEKAEVALDEPVIETRPLVDRLPGGEQALQWVAPRGGKMVLRMGLVGGNGEITGASDIEAGGPFHGLVSTPTPTGVTYAWNDRAGHGTLVSMACQPEVSRPDR